MRIRIHWCGNPARQKFDKLVAAAPDFFDYWIENEAAASDLNSLSSKMQIARELAARCRTCTRPGDARGSNEQGFRAARSIRVGDFETLVKRGEHESPSSFGLKSRDRPSQLHRTMWPCFVCLPCVMKRHMPFYSNKIGGKCWHMFRVRIC